ncbi:MAG: hypothetical protein F6K23_38270 [Okeania sp. SIO2C9]|uniref:hypothetical protein n=1 Tax=Okeania sp. SIO2C9 TaxID=2607791 RepID=UPI0013C1C443|nr:hypothetical protein [Okeania sp. SIO2C9]NEQ78322.1 hypothetical protein [Okeania sp. SIO2C9]
MSQTFYPPQPFILAGVEAEYERSFIQKTILVISLVLSTTWDTRSLVLACAIEER